MAFHVACPLTCRKICYCSLGAPGLLQKFEGRLFPNGMALEKLLATSAFVLSTGQETLEVLVPRLTKDHKKKKKKVQSGPFDGNNLKMASFEQTKPQVIGILQSESVEAEVNGKFELIESNTSDKPLPETTKGDENESMNKNVIIKIAQSGVALVKCKICSSNEISGSEKAKKMLSCKGCSRFYHRNCLKQWAQHRDIFNWASWLCSSCRYCEVCKRTGDANLLRFCKRCDAAYHSYCQQLSVKHMPSGPYLCPKHTRCHSCGSHVPGSGVSSRWFLSFNFCDACGRLFVKGKFCPICLKVYRESEPSPMVCCDVCEHWVHCSCDGISEERYHQFQKDDNLQFKCAACRGECHQIKDLEDAVRELWKRRDDSERDEIAQLQTSLGLFGKEEMQNLCPSSDEDTQNDIEQNQKTEKQNAGKFVLEKTEAGKNESNSLGGSDERGLNRATSKKAEKRMAKDPEGLVKAGRDNIYKLKLHFQRVPPEKVSNYISNGSKSIPRDRWKESQTEELVDVDSKVTDKKSGELCGSKQHSTVKSSRQIHRPKAERNVTEAEMFTSFGNVPAEKEWRKIYIKPTVQSSLTEPQRVTEQTEEKMRSTKLILDLSAHEFKKSDKVFKEPLITKSSEVLKKPLLASSKKKMVEVQLSGKKEQLTIENAQAFGDYPPPAWGTHSESRRRRRLPSSKFRDSDATAWCRMSAFAHLPLGGSERTNSTGSVSGSGGLPATTLLKQKAGNERNHAVNPISSEALHDHQITSELSVSMVHERLPEPARKKVKLLQFDQSNKDRPGKQRNVFVEGSLNKALKLKFKKQSVTEDEKQFDGMHESTVKGQRTKTNRSATDVPEQTSEDFNSQTCFAEKIDNGDDTSILQRLGLDAVTKRVEIYQSKKNSWHKGTIVAVFPHKSQFSIQYDNGDKEIQKYGKERVRLLSTSKRAI